MFVVAVVPFSFKSGYIMLWLAASTHTSDPCKEHH